VLFLDDGIMPSCFSVWLALSAMRLYYHSFVSVPCHIYILCHYFPSLFSVFPEYLLFNSSFNSFSQFIHFSILLLKLFNALKDFIQYFSLPFITFSLLFVTFLSFFFVY